MKLSQDIKEANISLLVPNASELTLLEAMLSSFDSGSELKFKLFKNDITPSDSTNLASSFTEATFTGYSEVVLDPDEWVYATVSGKAKATYSDETLTWVCTAAPHDVYGYFVVDNSETNVIWAERFFTKWTLSISDQPEIQPTFTLATAD